ncbi:hypothetical protein BN1723_020408 [Verticillium longisporum]|uniref:Uncharacterized protein n=1 Tax=Verticillium longisporum TaxID=100787 RepID=A0A0G4NMZ1_VERLO|nr:hypothetical protein BN1723_020408 [Verticillium longisporum]
MPSATRTTWLSSTSSTRTARRSACAFTRIPRRPFSSARQRTRPSTRTFGSPPRRRCTRSAGRTMTCRSTRSPSPASARASPLSRPQSA